MAIATGSRQQLVLIISACYTKNLHIVLPQIKDNGWLAGAPSYGMDSASANKKTTACAHLLAIGSLYPFAPLAGRQSDRDKKSRRIIAWLVVVKMTERTEGESGRWLSLFRPLLMQLLLFVH